MPDRNDIDSTSDAPTRRTVLRGAMLAGAAVPFLAACGSDSSSAGGGTKTSDGATSPGTSSGGGGGGGTKLISTSDVPEGGGVIFDAQKVVVTQPSSGDFKCFTAICTHAGCTVANVSNGTINCTCHGSMYSIKDGSVVGGPAPAPLAPEKITVKGRSISLA
ncbi:MAG: Rieske (2Fe-2S) protein [Nocardioidaceae bacterium]